MINQNIIFARSFFPPIRQFHPVQPILCFLFNAQTTLLLVKDDVMLRPLRPRSSVRDPPQGVRRPPQHHAPPARFWPLDRVHGRARSGCSPTRRARPPPRGDLVWVTGTILNTWPYPLNLHPMCASLTAGRNKVSLGYIMYSLSLYHASTEFIPYREVKMILQFFLFFLFAIIKLAAVLVMYTRINN